MTEQDTMTDSAAETAGERPTEAPEWLWYGEVAGQPVVTFGRWPKNGAQWRYKWAEIQPTEHDKPTPTTVAWAAWHPVKGFGQMPNACADIDDAIRDAKCNSILDDSPDWVAVRVEIRRIKGPRP